jgi:hypothetical protein
MHDHMPIGALLAAVLVERQIQPVPIAQAAHLAIRAVFLKGIGTGGLWPQLVAMTLLGTAMLPISILRFRKSLD